MRRKLSFQNKTDFDLRSLRGIVLAVARKELKDGDYPSLTVKVGYARCGYVTGKAVINRYNRKTGADITLYIPKDHTEVLDVLHRVKVCFDYVQGRHGGQDGVEFYDIQQRPGNASDYAYAKRCVIAKAVEIKKSRLTGSSLAVEKAEAAQTKVEFWEEKLKRAERKVSYWRRKLTYHSKRADKLREEEAADAQIEQGMSVEDFYKSAQESEQ
jgi:hypothetical protein